MEVCRVVATIEHTRKKYNKDPLFTVVLDHAYSGCKDPKDKIFAMMSTSDGRDKFDWEVSLNYRLPVLELYKRVAIWGMFRNNTLRSLSCSTPTPSEPELRQNLSSWMPNCTRLLDPNLLVRANTHFAFSAGLAKPRVV
jgi:hypothetical protein